MTFHPWSLQHRAHHRQASSAQSQQVFFLSHLLMKANVEAQLHFPTKSILHQSMHQSQADAQSQGTSSIHLCLLSCSISPLDPTPSPWGLTQTLGCLVDIYHRSLWQDCLAYTLLCLLWSLEKGWYLDLSKCNDMRIFSHRYLHLRGKLLLAV